MARKRNYLAAGPRDRDEVKARLVIIVSRANNERHRGKEGRTVYAEHIHAHRVGWWMLSTESFIREQMQMHMTTRGVRKLQQVGVLPVLAVERRTS